MLSLLLAVPSCIYSFWHGVIPTSYFIFILVSQIFYPGLALTVARGEMSYVHFAYTYVVYNYYVRYTYSIHVRTRMRIVRANKTEVVTCTCNKMASV